METKKIKIPEISDSLLKERMEKIKFVCPAMQGTDGKIHNTDEQDMKLFDLFYSISNVNPRTQAFNFDENRKWGEKASGIEIVQKLRIFVSIGGYYGFCKVTMAEVMAQIPEAVLPFVVAFSLDPEEDVTIIKGDYQHLPIILYRKCEILPPPEGLPKFEGLILPLSLKKANKFKEKIRPMINYSDRGLTFIDPGDLEKPFMKNIYSKYPA